MDSDIEVYVEELRRTTTVAWLNYEIWWVYKEKDTRKEYLSTMNMYGAFFQTAIHAHFVALLLELYRLYETRKDSYNISAFLKLLKSRKAVSPSTAEELEVTYAKAKPLWLKVSILRNKAYGHRAKALTVSEVFEEASVKPDELRHLVELTRTLLNTATHALEGSVHAFNLSARDDTLSVLRVLKAKRDG